MFTQYGSVYDSHCTHAFRRWIAVDCEVSIGAYIAKREVWLCYFAGVIQPESARIIATSISNSRRGLYSADSKEALANLNTNTFDDYLNRVEKLRKNGKLQIPFIRTVSAVGKGASQPTVMMTEASLQCKQADIEKQGA